MGNILNIINSNQHFHNISDECKHHYMECLNGPFMSEEIKDYFELSIVNIDSVYENKKYIIYCIAVFWKHIVCAAIIR